MDKELKYYNFIISKFEISEAFSFPFIGSKSYAQINSKVFLIFWWFGIGQCSILSMTLVPVK